MPLIRLIKKMNRGVYDKVASHDPGLYVALAFPILFTFILTFAASRLVSHLWPEIFLEISPGLHVHHFTYGIFILTAAGYLGLAVRQARAKFWVAMLMGIGLGLAMDEFGMWLRLEDDDIARWSYDGFNITIGVFLFVLTVKHGVRFLKRLWPLT